MTDRSRIFTDTRVARGPLLFISGQVPRTADGEVPESIVDQVRLVAANIGAHLAANGVGWESVVKVTYFLRDLADLATLREQMLEVLGDSRPTASLVEVSGLVDPRFRLEIEATAQLPD